MIGALKDIFDSYYNVLCKVGYIRQKETNILLIISFLRNYLCFNANSVTLKELKELTDMFECLINNSCLALDIPEEISSLVPTYSSDEVPNKELFIVVPDGVLPTKDINENKIYLIPRLDENGDPTNIYTEYFYKNNRWENLGESNPIEEESIDSLFE